MEGDYNIISALTMKELIEKVNAEYDTKPQGGVAVVLTPSGLIFYQAMVEVQVYPPLR